MVDFLIRPGIKQDFATVASIYNESIAAENSTMDEDFYTAENVGSLVDKFNVLQTALLKKVQEFGYHHIVAKIY
ncbi:MAG: hypothetical protein WA896_11425 [Spirulinaceae cyanobacterium]